MSRGRTAIHRFEVRPTDASGDPRAAALVREARALGFPLAAARSSRVYLLEAELSAAQRERLRTALLASPVLERSTEGAGPVAPGEQVIEVHPLPGVMDPVALTVESAVAELLPGVRVRASTGWRYDLRFEGEADPGALARRLLYNPAIEQARTEPWAPDRFPAPPPAEQTVRSVPLRELSDDELVRLSRSGHLFLSLAEMRAIRDEYRRLGREPTDIELETLAQTWSEHCVHKTLKSTVTYREAAGSAGAGHARVVWEGRPGVTVNADGSVTISNLLKSTVAAATHELIAEGVDWALSVFKDNSGVVRFDDRTAVNVKVETHNRPSAIEPYGGAATGVGGCIRDVMGTGLGAKPIANTDVFCVATPGLADVPAGCLPPARILARVIDGVRDYGNRMGIPTVNGAVHFDDRYVGNPLVFCGCIGVLPADKVFGAARSGDRIVALGGRTGRDGIHGATFSSAELTGTHADEFAHAVQIGNAIEEKRLLDALLRAREAEGGPLFSAVTDCGAGGFSSAIGEMGSALGAEVHLDRAPLKYAGLRYDEIWISESQERMILAVPEHHLGALRRICAEEGVEAADLGVFGTPGAEITLNFQGREVGRLSASFLHDGIPMPAREAVWAPRAAAVQAPPRGARPDLGARLLGLLAHPTIASKRWIVRQYDHEVQGQTVLKPLVGPEGSGPGDAAVLTPVPGSRRGLAVGCGLQTAVGDPALGGDPYRMAIAAVDECVRNLVCVGADPRRIAILDNFCWPGCDNPSNMGALVRACLGCYDAAKLYRTPFVSGKDSLHNQFRTQDGRLIEIPPTLLITGIGIVPDVAKCVTMDAKHPGNVLVLVHPAAEGEDDPLIDAGGGRVLRGGPREPAGGPGAAKAVADLIARGVVASAHDCSEGGPLVALAEMLIASPGFGADLVWPETEESDDGSPRAAEREWFGEAVGGYVLEVPEARVREVSKAIVGLSFVRLGTLNTSGVLRVHGPGPASAAVPLADLRRAFFGTLDW
ncbi:MAG: phosphoribosylformylglycinamidine synthase [Phycisphaerales bacterium]|nr:phosphoribosylformylglycinamidine synthase [Phycisphaerales bacterium]